MNGKNFWIGGIGIISWLIAAIPVTAQRHFRADSAVVGCYAITWSNGKTPRPFFPDTVRLTLAAARWNGYYAVRVDSAWVRRAPIGQFLWKRVDRDSLLIAETDGFTGVDLKLSPTSNGFQGIATAFGDVIDSMHPFPTWQANVTRVACKDAP